MDSFLIAFMAKTRQQKEIILKDIKDQVGKRKSIVFAAIDGLKSKDLFELRKRLKLADCLLKVSKKTLMSMVLKESKAAIDAKNMQGQVAMIFAFKDELMPAKLVYKFSLESKNLKILGGILDNIQRTADDIIELAKLPTREELLGRLAGSVASPLSGFVNVLQGNIKGLLYVLSNIK